MSLLRKLFGKKQQAPIQPKLMFANMRYGVVTAYFQETLESLPGGMVAPRHGVMIFTDDSSTPRTGTRNDAETVSKQTGRELRWVSEYAFYTICRGCVPPSDDAKAYGSLVCPSVPAAIAMSQNPPR